MKTTLKNMTFIAAGAILATTAGLYAATIDANINSFTQYIQEFFVTSDGTSDGDVVFSVNSSGSLENYRESQNGYIYGIANTKDLLGPGSEFAGVAGINQSGATIAGVANLFGFNQILLNATNDITEEESFFGARPGYIQIGNQINGSPISNIVLFENQVRIETSNTGNFLQKRDNFQLINTPELLGQVPFAGSVYETGTQMYIAGVADLFGSPLAILEYFDNGMPIAYVGVGSGVVTIEAVGNSIFINENGIRINNQYTLPATDGQAGQVLTTDGDGNLYRNTP